MPEIGDITKGAEVGIKSSGKYQWAACIVCGKTRWVKMLHGKPVTQHCHHCGSGNRASKYSDGRYENSGYIYMQLKKDNFFYSMASHFGAIAEHRYLMAKHLNRCLLPWEVIHHKNGIKTDNRLENLQLLPGARYHIVDLIIKSRLRSALGEIKRLREKVREQETVIAQLQKNSLEA